MTELKRNFPKKISDKFFEKFYNLKLITFTVFSQFRKDQQEGSFGPTNPPVTELKKILISFWKQKTDEPLLIESILLPIYNNPAFSKTSSMPASLGDLPGPAKLYIRQ